ncbi:pentatricopeptide repeat-containing protein At3g03580-like [Ricinus communis]|uniref:pentatricopeptide repeat-containing protein At3g03580-like n=1 Tax=Ricinus communis TaxID=3988 RepID=UPI00201A723C|nr:pentatricopeptide repeat-containing protein At3g03580-like [Ricinus communis]
MEFFEESIQLFREMVKRFRPDLLTITSVLRACVLSRDLEFWKFVHDYILRSGIEFDVTASNIVINTYAKCGDLLASRKAFDRMKCTDSVSWNTLINGYIQSRSYGEGVKLFKKMKMDLKPDSITFMTLLSISTRLADTELRKEIHCDLAKLGFDSDLVVSSALVDMYSKCGNIKDSLKVFENMKFRNIVTWNTIIAACVQAEDCTLAFRMISQMRNEELIPDMGTLLGILPICSLIAAKRQGKEVHACTFKFGFESTVLVGNALIEMYSNCGNLKYCIRVFKDMKTKDVVTWTALVSAYGIHSGLVEEGPACFDHMKVYDEPRIEHYACLVDLLSRSGQLSKAEEFIDSMPLKPDASIWGSLLSACRASGNLKIANGWDEVGKIWKCLRDRGIKKDPGCGWIEIKNIVHAFGNLEIDSLYSMKRVYAHRLALVIIPISRVCEAAASKSFFSLLPSSSASTSVGCMRPSFTPTVKRLQLRVEMPASVMGVALLLAVVAPVVEVGGVHCDASSLFLLEDGYDGVDLWKGVGQKNLRTQRFVTGIQTPRLFIFLQIACEDSSDMHSLEIYGSMSVFGSCDEP